MELSEKAPEAAEHRREGEAKAEPVKYQPYITDEEEVVKKEIKLRVQNILRVCNQYYFNDFNSAT